MIITTEMLFENNVRQIVNKIEKDYFEIIQKDFDTQPGKFPDLLTWLELNPTIVGEYFIKHLIEYGFNSEDLQ